MTGFGKGWLQNGDTCTNLNKWGETPNVLRLKEESEDDYRAFYFSKQNTNNLITVF